MGLFTSAAEEELAQAMLQELQYIRTHTSRTAEQLASGVRNNVLEVGTWLIGAIVGTELSGNVSRSWSAICGSVEIKNLGVGDMTVCSGIAGSKPNGGANVSVVQPGERVTIGIYDRSITIWGTPGDRVGIQAYTINTRTADGISAVDGGAA